MYTYSGFSKEWLALLFEYQSLKSRDWVLDPWGSYDILVNQMIL